MLFKYCHLISTFCTILAVGYLCNPHAANVYRGDFKQVVYTISLIKLSYSVIYNRCLGHFMLSIKTNANVYV